MIVLNKKEATRRKVGYERGQVYQHQEEKIQNNDIL
jgi:hypothetical protein